MADLEKRALGVLGPEVSVVGLGCNNFGRRVDLDGTRAVVDTALEQGITFLDTADIYGSPHGHSEEFLGEVLQGRRDHVVLATKFGMDMGDGRGPRGSPAYIRQAIEASLRRLRTDVIDYYWYHEPDGVTPIADTLETLDELVRAGTVRWIGASNFSAEQIEEADAVARDRGLTRFTAIQNHYSLLVREPEREVLPTCERLGLGFVPFFPLASGLLTGKYHRGEPAPAGTRLAERSEVATEEQFDVIEALEQYAAAREVTIIDVAIGALLARHAGDHGDRRRDQARAGARERRRRTVEARRQRHGGAGGAAEPMSDYDIHLDDKFGSLTLIDLPSEIAANEPWFNQTLTTVNDAVVRLGVIEGDFHWHHHDDTDEFFLVLEGQLLIDIDGAETVVLDPHHGYTVPKRVEHRTRAPVRTAILMVEAAGVQPTGD